MNNKMIIALAGALAVSVILNLFQQNSIDKLKHNLTLCQLSETNLKDSINEQNKEIEKMRVKIKATPKRDLQHITIKDNTCESELKAYKDLFKEFNK